jgi:hypothetical protein
VPIFFFCAFVPWWRKDFISNAWRNLLEHCLIYFPAWALVMAKESALVPDPHRRRNEERDDEESIHLGLNYIRRLRRFTLGQLGWFLFAKKSA